MSGYTIFPIGDQAITISFGNSVDTRAHEKVMVMKDWLQQRPFPGLVDIVIAYSSLTVIYDLFQIKNNPSTPAAFEFISDLLLKAYNATKNDRREKLKVVQIPVCYEEPFSPDLDFISTQKQISREKIIALHTAGSYLVYMIGFLPGFAYMAEVDERIAVPRREKPRTRVDAGSVGIAGIQTGIYPVDSPGGWQIIGRTPLVLFDKHADPPVKLEPGNQVHFYAITKKEFETFNRYPS